jgi:hyperosmotically inducible periplasmic protein
MKTRFLALGMALMLFFGLAACNNNKKNTAKLDNDQVENQLKQAGYNDVNVKVDNDKAVVTLTGDVKSAEDKDHAEQIAKSSAPNFVISNEIGVRPEGAESQAKSVDSNTDDAIKSDWKALEAKNNWKNQHINADVKNGVLTLKGDVDTPAQRASIEKSAAKLPNVQQVVNELQVKSANKHGKPAAAQSANE